MDKFIPVCEPYLNGNELKYVTDAVSTGWISSSGQYVNEFEKKFAEYCGCNYGVAVCNGTIALHLALVSLGIGKDDEVIIPTFTMIASAFAVCYTGAKPVFVDADKETFNIDTTKIEGKITPRTKAIMPVHVFGKMCDMDAICALAKKYNLYIVEDAAEAHGAEYKGKKSGSFSDIAAFSFFANKNITTGEGGMVVTNDEKIYQRAKYFKNVCFPITGGRNYTHDDIGFNYRMSNVPNKGCIDVCWMNTIVLDPERFHHTKEETIAYLKSKCIDTRQLFNGMHNQKSMKDYGCDCSGEYPVSDWLTQNGFYLPSASNLSKEDIDYICTTLKLFQER